MMDYFRLLCSDVSDGLFAEITQSVNDQKLQTLHPDTSQRELIQVTTVHLMYQFDAHLEVTWKEQCVCVCFAALHPFLVYFVGLICV